MLMSVSEIANLTDLSKVSIYNKLKLKEIVPYIIKNKGITYVSEDGVALIKASLNLKEDTLNTLDDRTIEDDKKTDVILDNKEIQTIKLQLKELNVEYTNSLKKEIELLKGQLDEKDKQINELIGLNKNNQVLLKQQQDKEIKQLQLEEHFQEVDQKLIDIKEKMEQRKENKRGLLNFFK
jgi:hypothetical protein